MNHVDLNYQPQFHVFPVVLIYFKQLSISLFAYIIKMYTYTSINFNTTSEMCKSNISR